jgi:hypothetical protein
MRHKLLTAALLATSLTMFVIGGAAQKPRQNSQDQTNQSQSNPGMMDGGMMGQSGAQGAMMGGGMVGMMGQMTTHHEQMSALMNKMIESMTAIQGEKDTEALKSKLAEHRALMNQMRSQMMQQGNMMQMMSGQVKISCPERVL